MIFRTIWERYFLREVLKVFALLIGSFYTLYALIDYSMRSAAFRHIGGLSLYDTTLYYIAVFIQRLDLLIPFALLIATIRTLINMNTYHEQIALLASGIRMKTIMRPFLYIGLFFTFLIYINMEFFLPYATQGIRRIEEAHFMEGDERQQRAAQALILKDHSSLIYQNFDSLHQRFFDVYWIRNVDNIYHMKYLALKDLQYDGVTTGYFVDQFSRDASGEIVQKASFPSKTFAEITFEKQNLEEMLALPSDQSLSRLWTQLPTHHLSLSDKEAKILTAFYRKLTMPWLCFLVVIAPASFCLVFTRTLPVFSIYICSMFGLVSFYLLMNAAVIIGQSQVIHPNWAIGFPVLSVSTYFTWKFLRI